MLYLGVECEAVAGQDLGWNPPRYRNSVMAVVWIDMEYRQGLVELVSARVMGQGILMVW